jgi:flagellar export protein FliJ
MRLRTIETLLRLARQAEDRARIEARGKRKALDDSKNLSQALLMYSKEYADNFVLAGLRGDATAQDLHLQNAFRKKLDQTRTEQADVIEKNRTGYEGAVEFVGQNRMRTRIFEGFEARERDRIRQLAERTEQATLDDLVNSRRVDDSAGTEDA